MNRKANIWEQSRTTHDGFKSDSIGKSGKWYKGIWVTGQLHERTLLGTEFWQRILLSFYQKYGRKFWGIGGSREMTLHCKEGKKPRSKFLHCRTFGTLGSISISTRKYSVLLRLGNEETVLFQEMGLEGLLETGLLCHTKEFIRYCVRSI